MTRILITGGQGALGWYIKRYFKQHNQVGNDVIASLSRQSAQEPGVYSYRCDLLDNSAVETIIKEFRPEKVFLLAWETTHGSYWQDPVNIEWANATINLAEHVARYTDAHISFAGTCAEYSWSDEKMIEGVTEENPATLYGQQKLRVTRHLLSMRDQGKANTNICRLFFPYSERENKNRVSSLVVQSILRNEPIHLRSGDTYRDLCHTSHIANAMCQMSIANAGGLYNMSTRAPLHLGSFLRYIGKTMGRENLVSWDEWSNDENSGPEPRYLYGCNDRVKPYLNVSNDLAKDIKQFVGASITRFE